jgi:TRAP transporter TAXI family solute receptor
MIKFIIFTIILATFLYTQRISIINKINSYSSKIEGFNFNFNNNIFSLEKPKMISTEVNLSTEGIPVMINDKLSDFNMMISHKLQEYVPLVINNNPGFSIQNLRDVNDHKFDLTIVQEELLYNAIVGKKPFNNEKDKNKFKNLRFVAGLYYEPFILLTYQNSGINSWKDIKGKTIGFPSKESGSFMNGIKIAQAYGLEAGKDFKYLNVDSMNRLANIFFQKQVDAIYLTTSNKNVYLQNLAKKMSLKFIGTNDIQESILKAYFPCDSVKYINTNNYYTNINTSSFIKTYATRAVIVAHKDVDSTYIYNLTKTLYQKSETLKFAVNNYLFNRDKLNLVEDAFLPSLMGTISEKIEYHPGSQKYYDEMYSTISVSNQN